MWVFLVYLTRTVGAFSKAPRHIKLQGDEMLNWIKVKTQAGLKI